jgi:hypothetical protein
LTSDIVEYRGQTEADVNAVREKLGYVKKQLDAEFITEVRNVSSSLAECRKQIENER